MADKVVQLTDKDGNNIFPTTQKNITMTDVDPGEGSALAADNYIAVYGGTGSLLDLFYPVGCFFETTDTTFNPNTAWGGVWDEDTSGRVLVARDSGTFSTVGATGGEETHRHDFKIGLHRYYGAMVGDKFDDYSGAWSDSLQKYTKSGAIETAHTTDRNNNMAAGMTSYNETTWASTGDTMLGSSLQPYMVVKRWHRIA